MKTYHTGKHALRGLSIVSLLFLAALRLAAGEIPRDSLVWPSPPDKPKIRFVRSVNALEELQPNKGFFQKLFSFIGGNEEDKKWFVQPVGVAVSPSGIVYVTDPGGHAIHILNLDKKEHDVLDHTKFGDFRSPIGCVCDALGNLYITDSERGSVVVLDEDLKALREIKGDLRRPTGIQIAGDRLYITDTGQHKIIVYSKDGTFVSSFGQHGAGAGEFNYPTFLAVGDSISVVDALNYRIQTFDLAGHFGSTFGEMGDVAGRFVAPKAIALDSDGNRYVTDALMDNIQIFNPSGQLLLIVGRKGQREGEFMTPEGICIDRHDRIFVVDGLNRRLQIFQYIK